MLSDMFRSTCGVGSGVRTVRTQSRTPEFDAEREQTPTALRHLLDSCGTSACGTVCRRDPILTPHHGSTRSGMDAKDLYFATCVAQPDFRSGVECLLRASSARLRASRDNISKLVAHATDGAFVHFEEVVFLAPFHTR